MHAALYETGKGALIYEAKFSLIKIGGFVYKYRVIKNPFPPSRAKIESSVEKLTDAFSKTTYLNII